MGRNSGSVMSVSVKESAVLKYQNDPDSLQTIKSSILSYSVIDRWNKNSEFSLGFNDEAQRLVETIAKSDYGLASAIANRAVSSPNWDKYGYRFSDKQAYVLAKTAIDNRLTQRNGEPTHVIWDNSTIKKVRRDAEIKSRVREEKKAKYNETYKKSTTKIEVGSIVNSPKYGKGTIKSIITKSSGYVAVKYDNGVVRNEMAFNLNGEDGNPLRKKKF